MTLCKNLVCDNEDKEDDAEVAMLTEVLHVTHIVTLCKNLVCDNEDKKDDGSIATSPLIIWYIIIALVLKWRCWSVSHFRWFSIVVALLVVL
jgi:hypothetical protein